MVELVKADGLEAWQSFLQAHAAVIGRIEVELEERGLIQLEWYDLLVAIQLAPEHQLRMMDVASALVLTRSNATRLVDRLEAAGLVRRERLDGDRRGMAALLTPAGREALRRAWPTYARGIAGYFLKTLTSDELRTITRAMARVTKNARPVRPSPRRRTTVSLVKSKPGTAAGRSAAIRERRE